MDARAKSRESTTGPLTARVSARDPTRCRREPQTPVRQGRFARIIARPPSTSTSVRPPQSLAVSLPWRSRARITRAARVVYARSPQRAACASLELERAVVRDVGGGGLAHAVERG